MFLASSDVFGTKATKGIFLAHNVSLLVLASPTHQNELQWCSTTEMRGQGRRRFYVFGPAHPWDRAKHGHPWSAGPHINKTSTQKLKCMYLLTAAHRTFSIFFHLRPVSPVVVLLHFLPLVRFSVCKNSARLHSHCEGTAPGFRVKGNDCFSDGPGLLVRFWVIFHTYPNQSRNQTSCFKDDQTVVV